jgi:hypothetical protein
MKNLTVATLVLVVIIYSSCIKSNSNAGITGTWALVSDSTYSSGIGPYGTPSSNKYVGTSGDHFIFTGNMLYVKEGTIKLDTATYTISNDTLKLTYNYLYEGGVTIQGAIGRYDIKTLTQQNLVLTEYGVTPGGIISETIILKRSSF